MSEAGYTNFQALISLHTLVGYAFEYQAARGYFPDHAHLITSFRVSYQMADDALAAVDLVCSKGRGCVQSYN